MSVLSWLTCLCSCLPGVLGAWVVADVVVFFPNTKRVLFVAPPSVFAAWGLNMNSVLSFSFSDFSS